MPSIPSLFPIPRISQALGEEGTPRDGRTGGALDKFLPEFCWYARALKRERVEGTPY